MLHSSVRCDAVDVCGCSTSARSTAPCGGATPGLTLIRGIIAHSTVFYEPAEMETLIRTRLSRPLVNMILYIPPSLPSSARPLVVFGAIVASNPNPAFVLILAALTPWPLPSHPYEDARPPVMSPIAGWASRRHSLVTLAVAELPPLHLAPLPPHLTERVRSRIGK